MADLAGRAEVGREEDAPVGWADTDLLVASRWFVLLRPESGEIDCLAPFAFDPGCVFSALRTEGCGATGTPNPVFCSLDEFFSAACANVLNFDDCMSSC